MPDRITTLLQGGVTNAVIGTALDTYLGLDPATVHQYFNDFDVFTAGDWTNTASGSPTNALVAGNGGILKMLDSAASADLDQLTLKVATFAFNPANAEVWFKSRFQVDDATNAQIAIGLQNLNTNAFAATDGVWFQKLAGVTTGNFLASASSTTTTSTQTVTMANNTYIDVGFFWNGGGGPGTAGLSSGEIILYANGANIGQMSAANIPATSTNLALTIAVENGTAAARTLLVDYILAAVQRDFVTQVGGA